MPIQDETELEDFMVEIDILSECKHAKIVSLYEAFFFDSALWVSSCESIIVDMQFTICVCAGAELTLTSYMCFTS